MIELMTPYQVMTRFANNIEKQRIRKNMTQADLYKAAGMSASGYANFLKNKNCSFENILKILFALDMTSNIEALLGIDEFDSLDEIRNIKEKKAQKKSQKG